MSAKIRELRERRGWSQATLADAAGVSRQLVSAVEAGRHVPNVAAAIALARALDADVEQLFAERRSRQEHTTFLGEPIASGSSVRAARVGARLVAWSLPDGVDDTEQWADADGVWDNGSILPFPDARVDEIVVAGCDPALGLLATLVARTTGARVTTTHATTELARHHLRTGFVHGALVHGPRRMQAPTGVRRFALADWQVGLASIRSDGVPSIEEIAERSLRVVQREPGAGAQAAFDRALRRVGANVVGGPIARGHLDVARRTREDAAAGVTIEATALRFGLAFAPLELHHVELWIDRRWSTLPGVGALLDTMNSSAFRDRLTAIGGYDLAACGSELTAS